MPVIQVSTRSPTAKLRPQPRGHAGGDRARPRTRAEPVEQGGQEAKPKFDKRGQSAARERLNLLLDPGAPFLELASLAGYKLHDDKDGSSAGGGLIAGIGYVVRRAHSGGGEQQRDQGRHHFPHRSEKIPAPAADRPGEQTAGGAPWPKAAAPTLTTRRRSSSKARAASPIRRGCQPWACPQITVVHGRPRRVARTNRGCRITWWWYAARPSCSSPGRRCSKAATGEVATDEELGGAEMHAQIGRHCRIPGGKRRHGVRQVREILSLLPWNDRLPSAPNRHLQRTTVLRRGTARADPG